MAFLDKAGLIRVWNKVKDAIGKSHDSITSQIAKSYYGTATEAIPKDYVFFSNGVLRIATTNIAFGDTINDTNSTAKKIADMIGGASVSEIFKSVYVDATIIIGKGYGSNNQYQEVVEKYPSRTEYNFLYLAPVIEGYKFLMWSAFPSQLSESEESRVAMDTLSDGTNYLYVPNYDLNGTTEEVIRNSRVMMRGKALAIYVKA